MKTFKFWKENKFHQEYEMTLDEIKIRYSEYLKARDKEWLYHNAVFSVRWFITTKEGLNSVADIETIEFLEDKLKPIRLDVYKKLGI